MSQFDGVARRAALRHGRFAASLCAAVTVASYPRAAGRRAG